MTLLFKPEHVEPILRDEKTQTRRAWKKCRVKVGNIQKAKLKLFSKDYFALLKIVGVRQEKLGNISEIDAKAEGGYTPETYRQKWTEINGDWNPDQVVYVVDFQLYKPAQLASQRRGEV